MVEVWVTEWALKKEGVFKSSLCHEVGGSAFNVRRPNCGVWPASGRHVHDTREEALLRVRLMIDTEIKKARDRIAKLEALDPEQVVPR